MTIQDLAALATVVAGFASVGSLLAVAWQLRSLTRQTKEAALQAKASAEAIRATVHLGTFASAVEIDRYFSDRPDLRQQFYGKVPGDGEQGKLQQVDAAAEMLIDQFTMVANQLEHVPVDLANGWGAYVTHIALHSPALRSFWSRHRHWYNLPALDQIIGAEQVDGTTMPAETALTGAAREVRHAVEATFPHSATVGSRGR